MYIATELENNCYNFHAGERQGNVVRKIHGSWYVCFLISYLSFRYLFCLVHLVSTP